MVMNRNELYLYARIIIGQKVMYSNKWSRAKCVGERRFDDYMTVLKVVYYQSDVDFGAHLESSSSVNTPGIETDSRVNK